MDPKVFAQDRNQDISEIWEFRSQLINLRERKEYELQEINKVLHQITDLIIYIEKS